MQKEITNKKFWVCNQLDASTGEILLYGYIGEWEAIDDAAFVTDLRTLESKYQTIHFRINCGGGDVYKGFTIFNAIKSSKAITKAYIDGIAASMGAVIPAACNEVHMSKYGRYMTHRVRGFKGGNADDMRAFADEMEVLEDNISAVLSKRTGLTKEEAKKKYICSQDRWIGADQAKEEKLVDSIYDSDPSNVPDDEKEPENIFNAFQQKFQNRLPKQQDTNMKEIAKALGLPENATEAEILSAINKQNTERESAANAAATANKARAKSLIDTAIDNKQLTEADRPEYQAKAESDYDFTVKAISKIPKTKKITDQLQKKDKTDAGNETTENVSDFETLMKKGADAVAEFKKENFSEYKKMWETHYKAPYAGS